MTRRPVIGSGLPSWPATGLRFPRTLAEAFPDTRAGWLAGPCRRTYRVRPGLVVALLAICAAATILTA